MTFESRPEEQSNPAGEHASSQSTAEKEEERRKIRRLQLMIDMVLSVLSQDPGLTLAEASEIVDNCKNAALAMFPGQRACL